MASPSLPPPPPDAGEGSDGGNDGNAARPKKLAWNKPSNDGVVEVSPVMGAICWPALSEPTKASPKSSADSTSKTLSDSPLSTSQGTVVPHSPKKQVTTTTTTTTTNNAAGNSNSSANHPLPTRQRSMKRGGGNNRSGPSQSGFTHPHLPPPPNTTAYVRPPPMRPFVDPMGYTEFCYIPQLPVEPYSHRPIIPHPPPLYIPVPEPLPVLLLKQIDYYFSDANLVKDVYLRSNMDDQGWVPIALIASFPRVRSMTTNVQLILDSLSSSTIVEVQDDKVRRRNEWNKWKRASSRIPSDSGSVSPNKSSYDTLATSLQKITVEEVDTNQSSVTGKADPNSEAVAGSWITEFIGQSQLPSGEDTQNTDSSGN
uniref:HTH La-type RNA-binding domain-containing protein n=2 Tax=Quercus lobata TaxID=97700 RepID=A0A7N2R2U0_QUELO